MRTTSAVAEIQDVDTSLLETKKGFVHGGDVEGADRPFLKSSYVIMY